MFVMLLPAFMRLRVSTSSQKLGLGLYLTGLLIYFASWAVLIVFPQCAWSTSEIGFMAPAYTPIVWLAGIGLIGTELLFLRVRFKPWIYWTLSALFIVFHNLHVITVFSRGILTVAVTARQATTFNDGLTGSRRNTRQTR